MKRHFYHKLTYFFLENLKNSQSDSLILSHLLILCKNNNHFDAPLELCKANSRMTESLISMIINQQSRS
mgnify:CR=1 FL=1